MFSILFTKETEGVHVLVLISFNFGRGFMDVFLGIVGGQCENAPTFALCFN